MPNFQPHVLWLVLAASVIVVIGLAVAFTPWVNTEDETALPPPTPAVQPAP